MSRKVVIDRKALKYLSELPEKSQQLIKEKCHPQFPEPWAPTDQWDAEWANDRQWS